MKAIVANEFAKIVEDFLNKQYHIKELNILSCLDVYVHKPNGMRLLLSFDIDDTNIPPEHLLTQIQERLKEFVLKSVPHEVKYDEVYDQLTEKKEEVEQLKKQIEELQRYKTFYVLYKDLKRTGE